MKAVRQPSPTRAEIAARARQLWQIAGAPEAQDIEFWLAAETELRIERWEVREAVALPRAESSSSASFSSPSP